METINFLSEYISFRYINLRCYYFQSAYIIYL